MPKEDPIEARDARAGSISGRVRNVLIASLTLAAIAFAAVYAWFTLST